MLTTIIIVFYLALGCLTAALMERYRTGLSYDDSQMILMALFWPIVLACVALIFGVAVMYKLLNRVLGDE